MTGATTLRSDGVAFPRARAGRREPRPTGATAGIRRTRELTRQESMEGTSETDGQLVERVRAGDERAFERLVRRHLRVAHSVARAKLGGDPDAADDVCQEAFITALDRIDECRDPERFRAWLLTIVRNKAHNYREYLKVRDTTSLDAVPGVSTGEDTSERVERRELREQLDEALGRLTELQRKVFVRFDMEGWDHGEIAEELGISRGSSRVHLHAARRALRKGLTVYPMEWSR